MLCVHGVEGIPVSRWEIREYTHANFDGDQKNAQPDVSKQQVFQRGLVVSRKFSDEISNSRRQIQLWRGKHLRFYPSSCPKTHASAT